MKRTDYVVPFIPAHLVDAAAELLTAAPQRRTLREWISKSYWLIPRRGDDPCAGEIADAYEHPETLMCDC